VHVPTSYGVKELAMSRHVSPDAIWASAQTGQGYRLVGNVAGVSRHRHHNRVFVIARIGRDIGPADLIGCQT
jgi:hypothetical protein